MQLSYVHIHNTDLVSSSNNTTTTTKKNTRRKSQDKFHSDMAHNNTTKNFGNNTNEPKFDQRYDDGANDDDSISSVTTFDYMSDLFEPIPWDIHNDAPLTALPSPFTQRLTKITSINIATATASSNDFVYPPRNNTSTPPQYTAPTLPSPPMIPSMPPPSSQSTYPSPYRPTPYYPPQPFVTPEHHGMPVRVQSSSFYNPPGPHNNPMLSPLGPWNNNSNNNKVHPVKKNSRKRQPRPRLVIQPRFGGIIYEPLPNDVLAGRGGRINSHRGNVKYRAIVAQNKSAYLDPKVRKLEKAHVAASIVHQIRSYGGRFLAEANDGTWYEVGDAKAIRKTGQALREDAQTVRGVSTAVSSSVDESEHNNKNDNSNNNESTTNRRSSLSSSSTGESTTSTASTISHQNHPGKQYLIAESNKHIPTSSSPLLLPTPEPIVDDRRNDSFTSLSSLVSISTIGTHASFIPLDDFLDHTSLLDMH